MDIYETAKTNKRTGESQKQHMGKRNTFLAQQFSQQFTLKRCLWKIMHNTFKLTKGRKRNKTKEKLIGLGPVCACVFKKERSLTYRQEFRFNTHRVSLAHNTNQKGSSSVSAS